MNDKTGKILVSVSAVLGAGFIAGVVTYSVPEAGTEKVYLPGPTVTETVHKPMRVEIPGPTVTKKVEVTKTVRPDIPEGVSRSNERKSPKKSKATVAPSGSARDIARSIFGSQFSCINSLIQKESGWSVTATNPSSGAYGLGQALPPQKMASAGADWRTSARTQLTWVKGYVDGRYGGACSAWSFWQNNHWY
jgi:hypothetical protein